MRAKVHEPELSIHKSSINQLLKPHHIVILHPPIQHPNCLTSHSSSKPHPTKTY
jgi:hypothetical protein